MATALVGLDLAPGQLRAAELTAGRRVRRVATLATDAIDERGEIVDGELLTSDIRRLWKLGHFRSRSVVVGLSSPSIATRPVEFPKVPAEDARSAARFEVAELLSFPLEEAIVGVEVWPDAANQTVTRALVVAAPASTIATVTSAVAGARLQAVDLRLSAASVAQLLSKDTQPGAVVADVGAARSSIAICENGAVHLIRQLPTGAEPGTSVTAELELELSRIQGFREGSTSRRDQLSDDEVRLGPVIEAVRGSIEFHLGQRDAAGIDHVVVTGTHRHSPGLVAQLELVLRLPVVVAPELTEDAQADGAAALVLDARTPDLSLMPPGIGAARRFRRAMLGSAAAAILVGVGLFGLSSQSAAEVSDLESRADAAENAYTANAAEIARLKPVVEADAEAKRLRGDVTAALEGDVDWRRVLASTTNAMPADSYLTAFRGQRNAPTAGDPSTAIDRTGDVTFSLVGVDQTTVGRWLIAAGDVPGLAEPRLTQSTLSAVGPSGAGVLFTVSSDLDEAAVSDRRAREAGRQR